MTSSIASRATKISIISSLVGFWCRVSTDGITGYLPDFLRNNNNHRVLKKAKEGFIGCCPLGNIFRRTPFEILSLSITGKFMDFL